MEFPILVVGLSIGAFFLKLKFAPRDIPGGKGYLVWFLSSIQSFVLSLLVGHTVWNKLGQVPQSFSDFISGNLAFSYQAKTPESLGLYAAVFCYILIFVGLISLYQFTNRVAGSSGTTILAFALFGLIPSAILLGQSLRVPSTSFLLVISGVTIILSILIVITLSVSFNRRILFSDEIRTVGSKLFLSTLFFIMSDISVSLVMSRLGNLGFPIGIISSVCISLLLAFILLGHIFGRNSVLKYVDFFCWVSQLFISLAFLVLFPPFVNSSGGSQISPFHWNAYSCIFFQV